MRRLLTVAVIAGLTALPGTARPPVAGAALPTPVALAGFTDLVVDSAHGHVFISQGAQGGVAVADLQGNAVTTIDDLVGVVDLDLTPSGDRVVAAMGSAHEIVTIDTTTLAATPWSTGDRCPSSVAPVDGTIWFVDSCHSGLGALAADGTVTTARDWDRFVLVRSRPSAPGTLVTVDDFDTVSVFHTSVNDGAPTPTLVAERRFDSVIDVEVDAAGAGVLVHEYGGWPQVWSLGDLDDALTPDYRLSDEASYRGPDDIRDDGALVVGPDVFEAGTYDALTSLHLDGYVRGVEWGDRLLYLVTEAKTRPRGRYSLRVVHVQAPSSVSITSTDDRIVIGQGTRLDLELVTRSEDRQVVVKAVTAGGTKVLARPRVPAAGTSIRIEPRRNTSYVVKYAGDADVEPSQDSVAVSVAPKVALRTMGARTVRHGIAYYRSGDTARLRATVEAFPGGCVTFHVYFRRIRQWIFSDSVKCVRLNRNGLADLQVRSRAGQRYYATKILVTFDANDDNVSARPGSRRIQFCPRSVPCQAPVG